VRATGPEIAAGGALRYLAELPCAPYAMACNRDLEWRELDARTVEVSAVVAAARQAVRLEFSDDGEITRASAERRPFARKGGYDLRPSGRLQPLRGARPLAHADRRRGALGAPGGPLRVLAWHAHRGCRSGRAQAASWNTSASVNRSPERITETPCRTGAADQPRADSTGRSRVVKTSPCPWGISVAVPRDCARGRCS
jgi:hypothetical protein